MQSHFKFQPLEPSKSKQAETALGLTGRVKYHLHALQLTLNGKISLNRSYDLAQPLLKS